MVIQMFGSQNLRTMRGVLASIVLINWMTLSTAMQTRNKCVPKSSRSTSRIHSWFSSESSTCASGFLYPVLTRLRSLSTRIATCEFAQKTLTSTNLKISSDTSATTQSIRMKSSSWARQILLRIYKHAPSTRESRGRHFSCPKSRKLWEQSQRKA